MNMNNGASEVEAYFSFGNRCIIPEIKRFVSYHNSGGNLREMQNW